MNRKTIWIFILGCFFLLTASAAIQAARFPTVNSDSGTWGTILNQFLSAEHTANGTHRNLTVEGSLIVNNSVLYANGTSGYVGIGTTLPNYLLQTGSGTDGRSVNLSNVLYVNGSSGTVGIGTTSPVGYVDINRNDETRTDLFLRSNITTGEIGSIQFSTVRTGVANPLTYTKIIDVIDSATVGAEVGQFKIEVYDYANTNTPGSNVRFRIVGSDVGIGVGSPLAGRLNVGGARNITAGSNGSLLSVAGGSPSGTLIEASSGTHTRLSNAEFLIPAITAADAVVTDTANVYIAGAPSATVTGNNYALWVDDGTTRFDGNVGINATAPIQTLTVEGTLNVSNPGTSGQLFLTSAGRVGINTTTPESTLSVQGTLNVSGNASGPGNLFVTSSGIIAIGTSFSLSVADGTTANTLFNRGNIILQVPESATTSRNLILASDSGGGRVQARIELSKTSVDTTRNGAVAIYNRFAGNEYLGFFQNGTGNVGIGATSPSVKLDVAGNVSITGNVTIGSPNTNSNFTMFSPNGSVWRCGPTNTGNFTCS